MKSRWSGGLEWSLEKKLKIGFGCEKAGTWNTGRWTREPRLERSDAPAGFHDAADKEAPVPELGDTGSTGKVGPLRALLSRPARCKSLFTHIQACAIDEQLHPRALVPIFEGL